MADVADHHPELHRYCILLTRKESAPKQGKLNFTVLSVCELELPRSDDILFSLTGSELISYAQPWIFSHLFDRGHGSALFMAPQIRLYRPLVELLALLREPTNAILLPRSIGPSRSPSAGGLKELSGTGFYSSDVVAMRNSSDTHRVLEFCKRQAGVERWLDALPAWCDQVRILRHPGYSVTTGDLLERHIHRSCDGKMMVDHQKLAFINFSGLNPDDPQQLLRGSAARPSHGTFLDLAEQNARALRSLGSAWYSSQVSEFNRYSDGRIITAAERRRFRCDPDLRRACAGQPFACSKRLKLEPEHLARQGRVAASLSELSDQWRLQHLYAQLLGRPATAAELRTVQPWMASRLGMLRLLLTTGCSREARRTPGWQARLLAYMSRSPMAEGPLHDYALEPLIRVLAIAARLFPSLAYQPCVRRDEAVAPQPHPKQGNRHAAASDQPPGSGQTSTTINILGHFSREIGIGEAARSLASSCEQTGLAVTRIDVDRVLEESASNLSESLKGHDQPGPIDLFYFNADTTLAVGRHLRAIGRPSGYRIGCWAWEQSVLPQRFHESFAEIDEVWVPSRFVHEAIAPVAPVPVITIPPAVQFRPTPGIRRSDFGLPQDKCLVLVMYDFHSFQERKNPRAALAAFRAAKAAEPALALVIKTINAQHHPGERQKLEESLQDLTDVTFLDAALTRQQAWDLESCCDILLSLHRAEGFGLILAEMMFLGKPVVATGWSANMDFMNDSNSVPVAFRLEPLARPVGPYEAGIRWAEPDVDHAASALRQLARDSALAARLGQRAQETVRQLLAPDVVGRSVRQRLNIIQHWYPRAGARPGW